jgi:hypothetical protein
MLEISNSFKLQGRESTKTSRMAISMKENGRKASNMEKVYKNTEIEINIMVNLCVVKNLVKDSINFQMEKYIMVHFIMDLVMDMEF